MEKLQTTLEEIQDTFGSTIDISEKFKRRSIIMMLNRHLIWTSIMMFFLLI